MRYAISGLFLLAGGQGELLSGFRIGNPEVVVGEIGRPSSILHPGDKADFEKIGLDHIDQRVCFFLERGGESLRVEVGADIGNIGGSMEIQVNLSKAKGGSHKYPFYSVRLGSPLFYHNLAGEGASLFDEFVLAFLFGKSCNFVFLA